jgi:hypothetical protein
VNSVDKLTEMVACDHLNVVWKPLVLHPAPHAWVRSKNLYIVVENGKVIMVCPECFQRSTMPQLIRSESH